LWNFIRRRSRTRVYQLRLVGQPIGDRFNVRTSQVFKQGRVPDERDYFQGPSVAITTIQTRSFP
jgi:hypothetical protein